MSKFTAWMIVVASFILPVAFGMFVFWLHGYEFVRGDELGSAFMNSLFVGGCCALITTKMFEYKL